ncbi:spermidine/putrescine ABC transporter membrane protein [Mycoplasmopsis californica]|uniref:ABC transporter permease subunit n=1 Tax=Mycoplasmopsis equigenitalium TaxID=114883 RepID=A0ABY5J4V3_9BACT|nr:ABC transporter permease subunit [Mycoplasmopsis equigenitalium]UUD36728.1 ABC transporter permease subunit [Mycoplasmopsis equigenitalium]VEU69978.1 spermidine/putrescine ABC transporter membrane protein [Mycoplasmopsis californica]
MSKLRDILYRSYVYVILFVTYIPLIFALIFSFNSTSKRGNLSFSWNQFSTDGWISFFTQSRDQALVNSFIIAFAVSVITIPLALVTVYALWKQKNKTYGHIVKATYNVPFINPEVVTAIGLILAYGMLFGTLKVTSEGIFRAILGHVVIALPYCITVMYPASEKFNKNLFEASQDLGYSKLRSWFKVYLFHMLPTIIFSFIITVFFSFDDFIITRLVSNTSTLGTKLYETSFRSWGLVVGGSLMIITLVGSLIYIAVMKWGVKWKQKN